MNEFTPAFPVHIYHEGFEPPTEGTYFLVSGNGLWLHKDTGIVKAFVPVDNISVLHDLDVEASVQSKLPKLPANHVWRIKSFFRKVVHKYNAEACTCLYFNKETGEFKIHIPQQKVSKGGVNYKRAALTHVEGMENFLCVGTIHSHCDFEAFHSGTDISDEVNFDGLHCTFGHNDLDEFSITASVVVNGFRVRVDPLLVLDGIEPVPAKVGAYRLAELAPELEAEWSKGLDDWMQNVSQGYAFRSTWWNDDGVIRRGDQVAWAGDLSTVPFKDTCGEGPFKVDSVQNGLITVVTKIGLARFSEKLFKKANA